MTDCERLQRGSMADSEPSDPSLNPSGRTEAGDQKTPSWEVAGSDPGFSIKLKTTIKIIRGHLLHATIVR